MRYLVVILSSLFFFLSSKIEAQEMVINTGHNSNVRCVAYSPDGKYFASSSKRTIKLWNGRTGKEIRSFQLIHRIHHQSPHYKRSRHR